MAGWLNPVCFTHVNFQSRQVDKLECLVVEPIMIFALILRIRNFFLLLLLKSNIFGSSYQFIFSLSLFLSLKPLWIKFFSFFFFLASGVSHASQSGLSTLLGFAIPIPYFLPPLKVPTSFKVSASPCYSYSESWRQKQPASIKRTPGRSIRSVWQ